jgi:hypothetical protein
MAVGEFALPANNPSGGGGTLTRTLREYTAGATWTKPSGLIMVEVVCVGGGGGGGSGGTSAAGIAARGGGGGGGACATWANLLASSLGATETITIGAGGTGGTGLSGSNALGGTGGAGGDTTFGAHVLGKGGNGSRNNGQGAAVVSLSATNSTPDWAFSFIVGGNGKDSASGGTSGQNGATQALDSTAENIAVNPGAPPGGGVNSSNAGSNGANGTRVYNWSGVAANSAGAGAQPGGNGNTGASNAGNRMTHSPIIMLSSPTISIGCSGSSGAGNPTGNGGNGGAGGNYGAPGGGGGGTRNGFTSGSGGNGSGGFCLVLEYTI